MRRRAKRHGYERRAESIEETRPSAEEKEAENGMAYDTLDMHILEMLSEDARVTPEQMAVMIGMDPAEVRRRIESLTADRVLIKYPALINWDRTDRVTVRAVIEVRVQPQRDRGFDAVAARIQQFEEVTDLHLMSGAYDLMVFAEAPTLHQLASFVSSKLSPIESVTGTSTHFLLKTYKLGGVLFEGDGRDARLPVSP